MPRNVLPEPYQLPDGRWRVGVQLGHGSREHRIRRFLYGSSPAAARAKRDALLAAHAQGQRPPDKRLTVGTYLLRWLDSLTVRERTATSYRETLENHVIPRIGGLLLTQLGPLDIDAMLAELAKKGVRPPTRAYALRVLTIALNVAVKRKRLIPYNPTAGADRVIVRRRKPVALTGDETRRLFAALKDERLGPLFRLLASSAIRRGEALALTWANWDREGQLLHIEATLLYRAGAGFERVDPKTDSSKRVIRLSGEAQAALVAQAKQQAAERLRRGRQWVDNDLVFTAQKSLRHQEGVNRQYGGAMSGATVGHALRRICEAADLPTIRPHDLRHTAATFMGERLQPAVVQAVLGHSSPAMTARYTHVASTSQEAADALDEALRPPKPAAEAAE